MDLMDQREALTQAGWTSEALDVLEAVVDELARAQVALAQASPRSAEAAVSYLTGRITGRLYRLTNDMFDRGALVAKERS